MQSMYVLFHVLLYPLMVSSVALAFFWTIVQVRVRQTVRRLPTGMDGMTIAEAGGLTDCPVLVVIPAHNEAGAIGPLIRSLREQDHQRFHVVLALDRCTDGTAAVARREVGRDHRFEIVEIAECPEGWAGKVNAVREGLSRTRFLPEAEQILFTDADCVLHPLCLRAASALARDRGLDLLSLLSDYSAERWYEKFVQPVAGFELMRQYPLLRANRTDERQRPFANGQFMLFNASFYRSMGGHEPVKDELLEDLALAREVKRRGGRGGAFFGGGIFRCRMYDSWEDFRRGWKRILTEAAQRRSDRITTIAWRVRILGGVLPVLTLVLGIGSSLACLGSDDPPEWCLFPLGFMVAGLVAYFWAMALLWRLGGISRGSIVAAPVGSWLVSRLLFEAAADLKSGEPTVWGGKAYPRPDRAPVRGGRSAGAADKAGAM